MVIKSEEVWVRRSLSIVTLGVLFAVMFLLSPIRAEAACNPHELGQSAYGMSGNTVSALQHCLVDAGFSIPAGVTGYYGEQTRTAVQRFYATYMGLFDWDGFSVGPLGRAKLGVASGAPGGGQGSVLGYKRAESATELGKYISEQDKGRGYAFGFANSLMRAVPTMSIDVAVDDSAEESSSDRDTADRVSDTNVQVSGIDEPDIVKTDGNSIFISQEERYYIRPMMGMMEDEDRAIMPEPGYSSVTKVIDPLPVSDMKEIGKIDENGELLLVKDAYILVVLTGNALVGYDVADPKNPKKQWTLSLEDNTSLLTARLTDNTIYLVTQTWLDRSRPCPIVPIMRGTFPITIPCTDIWVPASIEPISHTYTVLAVNPKTGEVGKRNSFAGESGETTIAMFKDNLYVATKEYTAPYKVLMDVAIDAYNPYISGEARTKIAQIRSYDISTQGMLNEITLILEAELAKQSTNERMKIENEIENKMRTTLEARKRELDHTRIAKISLADLTISATGGVSGALLNQFAMDEYNGDLRVAVTVNGSWWASGESANDVYVLGPDLKEKGRVTDLGLDERIYAVRFMGDTGYLVTFRQIDPFYVLDLSVPTAPKMVGELKIPGYSAYLEALGNDLVLGVGRDGENVKLSLFDVSDPARPVEKAKYSLKEYWTEVENNHHAFLRDATHNIFFLPGGEGGYVFSYAGGNLSLKATVAGWSVKRAVYINDYLYIIGEDSITVLDENTWNEVGSLDI